MKDFFVRTRQEPCCWAKLQAVTSAPEKWWSICWDTQLSATERTSYLQTWETDCTFLSQSAPLLHPHKNTTSERKPMPWNLCSHTGAGWLLPPGRNSAKVPGLGFLRRMQNLQLPLALSLAWSFRSEANEAALTRFLHINLPTGAPRNSQGQSWLRGEAPRAAQK